MVMYETRAVTEDDAAVTNRRGMQALVKGLARGQARWRPWLMPMRMRLKTVHRDEFDSNDNDFVVEIFWTSNTRV